MLGFRQTSVHVFYFWFIRLHLPRRMNLFLFPLRTPRTRKRPPRAPTSPRKSPHGSCSANDNTHRRTQNRPPCPRAPSRAIQNWPLEHDRRNHRPKTRPFSLPKAPQNHPFARTPKAASVNSYSKPAISYNAPPKVLPRRARCLLLHCHQDSNEIQIKK